MNIRINNFNVIKQGNSKVIIQGIEVFNLDVMDNKALSAAYSDAVAEAKEFALYLSKEFDEFKNAKFEKAASKFIIPESIHFIGEHRLSVSEILNSSDFIEKIALSSRSVDASKLVEDGSQYIIGKPVQYGIPLGCIVPLKVDNLLMVGNKISYSSLASTSAANMATNINIGESAGITAVYTIIKDITPRDVVKDKYRQVLEALQGLFIKNDVYPEYLKSFAIPNPNSNEWVFPAIQELTNLGLIAGGTSNDFRLKSDARQSDLATILLNSVHRLSPEKYSLAFDGRIRPYIVTDKLSVEKASEIILAFHSKSASNENAYKKACSFGFINTSMQARLANKNTLSIEDVLYLSTYNIELLTNKEIPG